jgi:geranylgeranyl diphosphate synthase type I
VQQGLQTIDSMLDELMYASTIEAERQSPTLAGMIRYHMGWVDHDFTPIPAGTIDQGKRIRPRLALLTCRAVAGDDQAARHLAAAIELLHNFTLVHDDIQDESHYRRHRQTVWSLWGAAQAINTGDAMYAASRRTLLGMASAGVAAAKVLAISDEFDRVAMEIVAGQVTDLEFEGGREASHDDYLGMIGMKTAAIVEFAAWAGAASGGADSDVADTLGRFGRSLGLGFQIRDDVLGIWGTQAETGKPAADDIRRRKQSLPVILLREAVAGDDRESLESIFRKPEIDETDVERTLALLDAYQIRQTSEAHVTHHHDRAARLLDDASRHCRPEPVAELRSLVDALALRTY